MTTKLSLANLSAIQATAAIPAYDRSGLKAGIVHFGVGNFHRAHMAIYLDDLFNTGVDHDWAIIGAGVLPSDEAMRAKLEEPGLPDNCGRGRTTTVRQPASPAR